MRKAALPALALLLSACNPFDLDTSGKMKPATEETVRGTWRNAEPADAEGNALRMTLRIDANHTMVWSRRYALAISDGNDKEFQRENWTWSVEDGKLKATKTACEYGAAPDYALKAADCKEPLVQEFPITVNGNVWKISEGAKVMVFRKD